MSSRCIDGYLKGYGIDKLPLGEVRTHIFCDLSFMLLLLYDKLGILEDTLAGRETALPIPAIDLSQFYSCRSSFHEHTVQDQQLRLKYNKDTLEDTLKRTIDLVLTYDLTLDLPELKASWEMWRHELISIMDRLSAKDDPQDYWLVTKLDEVLLLLDDADTPSERKEITDLRRLTKAYGTVSMFKHTLPLDKWCWDLLMSALIRQLESMVRWHNLHPAPEESDAERTVMDRQLTEVIHAVKHFPQRQPDAYSLDRHEPYYFKRLLILRLRLAKIPRLDQIDDIVDIIGMLEKKRDEQREVDMRESRGAREVQ